MQTANNADRSLRTGETGHQWVEELTNAQGTLELNIMQTFRVRATGATTVTIDGTLAMTMSAGEIAIFCVGRGSNQSNIPGVAASAQNFKIPVVIAGANAFVQVALDKDYAKPQLPGQYFPS